MMKETTKVDLKSPESIPITYTSSTVSYSLKFPMKSKNLKMKKQKTKNL